MNVPQEEPWGSWPSGDYWTIGILSRTPSELSKELGIRFGRAEGDLGPFQVAALGDQRLGQLWLVSLAHATSPGTDVRVDLDVTRDTAMHVLWMLTGLDVRAFKWVNPYPAHPFSHRLPHAFGLRHLALTPKETEIVELLGSGAEQADIARRLGITTSTLRSHLTRLRLKFQVQDLRQLRQVIADSRVQRPGLSASA